MIHEIAPNVFDNQYKNKQPESASFIVGFVQGKIAARIKGTLLSFPTFAESQSRIQNCVYLFTINETDYFLADLDENAVEALELRLFAGIDLRDATPRVQAFAAMTALHLARWYASVQYCGRCGAKTVHHPKERAMSCPNCRNLMFPKISPAIVVAVTDGERLLVTRYARRGNTHYALVAGFIEIGETAEECVRRELMEEVGIHVKDIRYYASQPWGFDGNLMIGFTARLDGSRDITLDENELAEAAWLKPEELNVIPDHSSLTREMISRFRKGELFDASQS